MKKRVLSLIMAIVMCLGFAVPVFADRWNHYPEDGPYVLNTRGRQGEAFLQITLVADEPIYYWTMEEYLIRMPLETELVIELFHALENATTHFEHVTVKLGVFNGNATRYEHIEQAYDGTYWLDWWYELEFDYITLLDYRRDINGFVVGYNRVVHALDTANWFYVNISSSTWSPPQAGTVQGNVMPDFGSPRMLIVGGGGNVPRSGFMQIDGQQTSPTTAPNLNTASTWARDGISQAFELGLIPQALQNNYTANTTRAEFSALAVYLYETVTGRTLVGRTHFNDTTDINVQKMGYLGVVTGVGGGNFAPNDTITREQAAVMIARLANAIGQPLQLVNATFADNGYISSWALEGVGQVQGVGIMGGVGNNIFAPRGLYTREQSIITMLRLFDLLN